MINLLEQLFTQLMPDNSFSISADICDSSASYNYLVGDNIYLLCDKPVPYPTLILLKRIVTIQVQQENKLNELIQARRVLVNDLLVLLAQDSLDEQDEIQISSMFGRSLNYAIYREGELLFNRNIKQQTLAVTTKKLAVKKEFQLTVGEGELFATSTEFYAGIFESATPIMPAIKQVLKLKLLWLNKQHQERQLTERLEYLQEKHKDNTKLVNQIINKAVEKKTKYLKKLYKKLERDFEVTLNKAVTDSLTNTFNRHKVKEYLDQILLQSAKKNEIFSLVMMDLDHFKQVNDTYGHLTGDKVLVECANRVKQELREADILSRWGGEEFLVILPYTKLSTAVKCAQRLRKAIALTPMENIQITASFGVSSYQTDDDICTLLERVDSALYQAKHEGRNRVCKL